MTAGPFTALSWALPLAQCFVRSAPAPRPAAPACPAPAGLRSMLQAAWRRHRSRRCLVGMNPYLLKDIGVSFAEAEAEANKPFWIV